MAKSPAFQFYPDDFVGSGKVGQMSAPEVGVYVLLLCLEWSQSGFVFDVPRLARWCRVTRRHFVRYWEHIGPCFEERDGRMYSPRLELEREKQKAWREKSSEGGKRGATARWGAGDRGGHELVITNASPTVSPTVSPIDGSLISHLSNTTTHGVSGGSGEPEAKGYPPEFELLWKAYPKRAPASNKAGAYRWYKTHLKRGVAYDVMFEGAKRYAAYCIAEGSVGTRYVKDAQTFFGPDKHFLNDFAVASLSQPQSGSRPNRPPAVTSADITW